MAQALIPYYESSNNYDDYLIQNYSSNNSTSYSYYYYGSNPPWYPKNISGWEGVVAGVIFVIESLIYLAGWCISNYVEIDDNIHSIPWWLDLNMCGNILFFLLSFGYLLTAVFALQGLYYSFCIDFNLIIAILFVIDSLLYLLALTQGSHSRTTSWITVSNNNDNNTKPILNNWRIDYYLFGSLFFVIGSVVYVIAAVQDFQLNNSEDMYLLGAIIFMIDAPLYIISGYQIRSASVEVSFLKRKYIFFIELKD